MSDTIDAPVDTTTSSDPTPVSGGDAAASTAPVAPVVAVKLRVFIPCRAVFVAFSGSGRRAFAGDGRDFSYDAGTSRAELTGSVTVGVPGTGGATQLLSRQFGLSEEYKFDDVVNVSGKPDWWFDLKPGYTVIGSGTQTADDDSLNMVAGGAGSTTESVFSLLPSEMTTLSCITVDGALPLMAGAPAIDATLYTHFKVSGGRLLGLVHGSHDGFPAYELYFNQQLVYSFDPVAAGTSPMNLLPPEDITVNGSYVDLGPA